MRAARKVSLRRAGVVWWGGRVSARRPRGYRFLNVGVNTAVERNVLGTSTGAVVASMAGKREGPFRLTPARASSRTMPPKVGFEGVCQIYLVVDPWFVSTGADRPLGPTGGSVAVAGAAPSRSSHMAFAGLQHDFSTVAELAN